MPDPHHHRPVVGKLDGIAEQIADDLVQPQRVAQQGIGNLGVDLAMQRQAFFPGRQRQQPHRIAQTLAQRKRDALRFNTPRLDPGQIQRVIDDAQQRGSRGLHQAEILALLGAQLGLQGELHDPDHDTHRITDLMTHARQKLGLGLWLNHRPPAIVQRMIHRKQPGKIPLARNTRPPFPLRPAQTCPVEGRQNTQLTHQSPRLLFKPPTHQGWPTLLFRMTDCA